MNTIQEYQKLTFDNYFSTENRLELLENYLISQFNNVAEHYRSAAMNNQEIHRLVAIHVPQEMVEDTKKALEAVIPMLNSAAQGVEPLENAPAINKRDDPTDGVVIAFIPTLAAVNVEGNSNIPDNLEDSDLPEEVLESLKEAINSSDPDPLEWTKHQFQLTDVNHVVASMVDSLDQSIGFSDSLPLRLSLNDRKIILLTALATARMIQMFEQQKAQPAYNNNLILSQ